MARPKYEPPSSTFPYKIPRRLQALSMPRKYFVETGEDMPPVTNAGVRLSALTGRLVDRNSDLAWPYLRRLVMVKRMYKNKFTPERLERIDRMIDAANATVYSKFANCAVDTKKQDIKDLKKKKPWTETEWKRHMEYIGQIAAAKKECEPSVVLRGESRPLSALTPRLTELASKPDFKVYKRMSQEAWYRDPQKVAKGALKYQITDRTKKLATPRANLDRGFTSRSNLQ